MKRCRSSGVKVATLLRTVAMGPPVSGSLGSRYQEKRNGHGFGRGDQGAKSLIDVTQSLSPSCGQEPVTSCRFGTSPVTWNDCPSKSSSR